jgi:nucleoid DNA-binding protein
MSATASKPMTKTEVISSLADATNLSKQQVNEFFDELTNLIAQNLKEGGPGVFNVPGMLKVKVVRKEAKPEREGIDPFTKEKRTFKAQPAKNVVKVSALKKLKDAVQ